MKNYVDNFEKYAICSSRGISAKKTYEIAKQDGLNFGECIRMLRQVYTLSLIDAKEVIVTVDEKVNSLAEFQEKLTPLVESELNRLESQV